jgi:hypothetical protein
MSGGIIECKACIHFPFLPITTMLYIFRRCLANQDTSGIDIPTVEIEKKKMSFAKKMNSYKDLINVVKKITTDSENESTKKQDTCSSLNNSMHNAYSGSNSFSERSVLLDERDDIALVKDEIKLETAVSNKVTSIEMTLKDSLAPFGIKTLNISRFNPWDWSAALDTLNMTRSNGSQPDLNFFLALQLPPG